MELVGREKEKEKFEKIMDSGVALLNQL